MVLNVVLAATVVYAVVELRGQYLAARARQTHLLNSQPTPLPAPQFTSLPEVAPVMASGYANVAQKFLLDPSRDPNLPIEPPPPEKPKPPMPPLPVYHGMWNIGEGPEIIMSLKADSPYKRFHAGEAIGDFKLVAFNAEKVELEWDGQRIIRMVADLSGHRPGQVAQQAQPDNSASAGTRPPVTAGDKGPGIANPTGERSCQLGDTSEPGTVKDGVVKTVGRNALTGGEYCIWKPVR